MRQRIASVLMLLALAPLLLGGGINPDPPGAGTLITGPAITAVVVMYPFAGGVHSMRASIVLKRGGLTAGAVFRAVPDFGLGCRPDLTDDRFLNNRLKNWIPTAGNFQGDVLGALFTALGIAIGPTNDPLITDISNVVCVPEPIPTALNPDPRFLSFEALIQFAH